MNKIDELLAELEHGEGGRWSISLEKRLEAAATIRALREALDEIVQINQIKEWTATKDNPETHWVRGDGQCAKLARAALEASHGRVGE